jgi:hypothetical protein
MGEPHTLGDVATDHVIGVRGQAGEIVGNEGIFFVHFPPPRRIGATSWQTRLLLLPPAAFP